MRNRGLLGKVILFCTSGFLLLAVTGPFLVRPTMARAHQDSDQSGAAAVSGQRPKFEVASVKPCEPGVQSPPGQQSPGRLTVSCASVRNLIGRAYVGYPDGKSRNMLTADLLSRNTVIEGLPQWGETERFTISAEAPGDASFEMMNGPMMQSLLEDRFKLKIYIGSREVNVYDLVVAKGGPKLPQRTRTPYAETGATPRPLRVSPVIRTIAR